jgi:hypothetical protein
MPKDFGNKIKWHKRKKRVRSNLMAAVRKDKYEDVDKYTKWTEVVRVVISKITVPSRITWTREIGPKRDIFKSSCNKNYLPWFSRFKFRNKIRESG